jgi:hypothetical protein
MSRPRRPKLFAEQEAALAAMRRWDAWQEHRKRRQAENGGIGALVPTVYPMEPLEGCEPPPGYTPERVERKRRRYAR